MSHDSPRVFTIPAGTPFLDALARALIADPTLGGQLGSAVALADIKILLPTRRAVRALGDAFLRMGEGRALLLPDIRPLGDVDEDELVLAGNFGARLAGDFRQQIGQLERQLRLARLILDLAKTPDESDVCRAAALAGDLGRFLDMVETERVDLGNLAGIVPDEFAENWQLTIEFLKLLTARWPAELERLGLLDPARRRNLLLDAEAAELKASPPKNPIIGAGSTGSIPATAALLETISRLPNGAIVLPGLDLVLDSEGWEAVSHSHPQYGMKQLLTRMQAAREDVTLWPGCEISPAQEARARLLSEALRPAETTERWQTQLAALSSHPISSLFLLEIEQFRGESEAIAMMMRETLETPGKTAALVTPDRALARRVAMDLRRWNIEIDDSGGIPLAQTPPLAFLRLVAEMVAQDFAPVPLLACLKHPLAALGEDQTRLRTDIRRLELRLLRGPRPAPGIDGLHKALAQAKAERPDRDFNGLETLIARIEAVCAPLKSVFAMKTAPLADILRAHVECAEGLADDGKDKGAERLWSKDDGEAASLFVNEMMEAASALDQIETRSYARLFSDLAGARVVRPKFGRHPRLFIWGPLEARLQHADRVILGGLNEGTWPAEANIDPWLNRPMRSSLHLEPPERRIGLSAHDFVEGASAAEVILTRALKVDGAPTVASRWLLRLQSLLKGIGKEDALKAPHWLHWATALNEPGVESAMQKPMPRPPLRARPVRFRVTEIETLIRDPYAIYARKILGLDVLDPIDANVAAAERGTIIHEALEKFATAYPDALPEDAFEQLIRIGADVFETSMDRPGVAAFWWPRFQRIARWIVDYERKHREAMRRAHAEVKGEVAIEGLARKTMLVARADRIDEMTDGTLAIVDYKTGQIPSIKQVETGLSPQLPLEAAMAARGGFEGLAPAGTSRLLFLRLTGGETAGERRAISPDGLADETWARLVALLAQYEDEATPYLSRPRPMFEGRFGDYDHLARVKEWSASGEGGE
ncbi:MAG: double-strand break repair protein AddB [Parvibaculum sp.]|uniref:double-strand break repair protein AddB n=1 Tax=Parvibaculum sp. TaxID=2024848 RepID=UPI0025E9EB40|nr:double-strand break repair protein AddB [Parvibaculum sp.]MCE9650049.1 double-strand break repair protein AddB [Parvibaculum sp.]